LIFTNPKVTNTITHQLTPALGSPGGASSPSELNLTMLPAEKISRHVDCGSRQLGPLAGLAFLLNGDLMVI